MKNVFLKNALVLLFFILPGMIYADQQNDQQKVEKTYTLKITSATEQKNMQLTGSVMDWRKDGAMYSIDLNKQVTPYETTFKATDLGILVMGVAQMSNKIKVELTEQSGNYGFSGEGSSIMAYINSAGLPSFITSK